LSEKKKRVFEVISSCISFALQIAEDGDGKGATDTDSTGKGKGKATAVSTKNGRQEHGAGQKRQRNEDDDDNEDENDIEGYQRDDPDENEGRNRKRPKKLFACPYYKRSPQKHPECRRGAWPSVHRLRLVSWPIEFRENTDSLLGNIFIANIKFSHVLDVKEYSKLMSCVAIIFRMRFPAHDALQINLIIPLGMTARKKGN
jgi:hypothetical protein